MKKGFILFSTSILLLLSWASAQAQTPKIDIVSASGNINICECDTIGTGINPENNQPRSNPLEIFISDAPFAPLTKFYFEITTGTPDFSSPDTLELFTLTAKPASAPLDTHSIGSKLAHLVIPCFSDPIPVVYLRVVASSGQVSDTISLNVSSFPEIKPIIDSIAGGFPSPYTPGVASWGFCPGDSIELYANSFGANITWLRNGNVYLDDDGNPFTNSMLVVKEEGSYGVRVTNGLGCARDSKDTIISVATVPKRVFLEGSSGGFQIDNPNVPPAFQTLDSITFCENGSAVLIHDTAEAYDYFKGYFYQWYIDTTESGPSEYLFTDTLTGRTDTLLTFLIDSSLFSFPGGVTRLYLEVTDSNGCRDTSDAYYIYMDSIPETDISHRIYSNGALGPLTPGSAVCFEDSVQLRANYFTSNINYQWEWSNDLGVTWTADPADTNRTLLLDSNKINNRLVRYYRVRTSTSVLNNSGLQACTAISDTITVRWWKKDSITYQAEPFIYDVGVDSISLCAADSAVLIAPSDNVPQLITNGIFYNYQWMRDSSGFQVDIPGETLQQFSTNENGVYYVRINDGICDKVIGGYSVFVDSIPTTSIVTTPFSNGTPSDLNLCLTDSTLLSAVDTILPGWNYQWEYLADTAVGWETMTADTMPWVTVDTSYYTANDTVLFRLSLNYENDFGLTICDGYSDTLQVVFYNPPIVNVFPGDSIGVCAGDSVLVIAQGNSLSHLWTPTGEVTSSIWISTPGTYTVTGTGINGCRTTARVVVYPITTTANAGPDVTTTSGTDVFLSGSGGTGYRWYASKPIAWSDNSSPNIQVSYTLPEGIKSDTITIYLEATNTAGCLDTDSLLLIVNADEDPGVSLVDQAWNVFTPGDGNDKNNTWDIRAITNQYSACRIDIMNRWGSIIFNQEDFNGIWDGRDNGGQDAPEGTYYYILSCDGEVILKNAVTIIRNQ